jgi:hypothetical protein
MHAANSASRKHLYSCTMSDPDRRSNRGCTIPSVRNGESDVSRTDLSDVVCYCQPL